VLVDYSDWIELPLACSLSFAASLYRRILLIRFLHKELSMLPVKKTFVVEAFRDTKHHLRPFSHSAHNFIKQKFLFVMTSLEVEIHKTSILRLIVHGSVDTLINNTLSMQSVRI
jgi:hypothetical protein